MSARIAVVCSGALGSPDELLARARALAAQAGGDVAAVALGSVQAQPLIERGADTVYAVAHPLLDDAHVEAMAEAIVQVCGEARPSAVLLNHNTLGADLAPRIAFRLAGSAATGCVAVDYAAERFQYTRPRQGGIAREVLSFRNTPVVATLRAGHYPAEAPAARSGTIVLVAYEPSAGAVRTRIVERQRERGDAEPRLEDAKIIVSGGRGLNGSNGFRVLEELAAAVGGVVGASRVPCDLGWCPRSWQIGLTGKTVIPDLYIAVGISGAGHHMAGCGNAKTIVAVNTDRDAAIFRDARYGLVGDYRELIPALVEEIRKATSG